MTTRREQILEQVAAAQRAQERMLRELAAVGPLENFLGQTPDQGVLRYRRQYNGTGPSYSYAAIKVSGRWYETGRRGDHARTTEEMAAWLVKSGVTEVQRATEWEEVGAAEPEDLLALVASLAGVPKDELVGRLLDAAREER